MPIFSEQIDTTISRLQAVGVQIDKIAQKYSELFVTGVPERYEDLSLAQKQNLATAGGDVVQLMIQKITVLNKVMRD